MFVTYIHVATLAHYNKYTVWHAKVHNPNPNCYRAEGGVDQPYQVKMKKGKWEMYAKTGVYAEMHRKRNKVEEDQHTRFYE